MIKTINKTYRFRIYPNDEQKKLLNKHFGSARFVYNYFLNQRQEQYKEEGESDNYYAQAKVLTELKKKEETAWLKEVNSQTLQFALRNLETAYTNFFQKRAKFPNYHSKKGKNTFTIFGKINLKYGYRNNRANSLQTLRNRSTRFEFA